MPSHETCIVLGCNNRKKIKGIHFFRFPDDEERLKKWCTILQVEQDVDEIKRKRSLLRICSGHFKQTDMIVTKYRTMLNRWAIPSLEVNSNDVIIIPETATKETQTDPIQRSNDRYLKNLKSAIDQLTHDHDLDDKLTKFLERTDMPIPLGIFKRLTAGDKYSKTLSLYNVYYPDEVKKFAYRLYTISPEAYEILYDVFKDGLPRPSIVPDYAWQLKDL